MRRLTGRFDDPRLTAKGALRVPQITVAFWVIKGLSTGMGEAASDYLVHAWPPEAAVIVGFAAFVLALYWQFRAARYVPWRYWFAVAMVGTFGTMAADVLHVKFKATYTSTSILYGIVLIVVFVAWQRTEGTLSIHSIDTPRREAFYWAAVVTTFAMGTAVGDFTASTLKLGYFPSALLFGGLILIAAAGYRWLRMNGVLAFWTAYILTRPLGASVADGFGKAKSLSGMGWGDGWVALVLAALIAVLVGYLSRTGADVQAPTAS
jgi:uncharacterized membrane-anchored protein